MLEPEPRGEIAIPMSPIIQPGGSVLSICGDGVWSMGNPYAGASNCFRSVLGA